MFNEMVKVMFSNKKDGKRMKRLVKKWAKLALRSIKEIEKLSPDGKQVVKDFLLIIQNSFITK